jgi:hypothetical protein
MTINKQVLKEIIIDQRQLTLPDYSVPREKHALVTQCFPSDLVVNFIGIAPLWEINSIAIYSQRAALPRLLF